MAVVVSGIAVCAFLGSSGWAPRPTRECFSARSQYREVPRTTRRKRARRISALFSSEEDSKENSNSYISSTLDVSTDPRSVVPDAGYPDFPDDQHGYCGCEYCYIPHARQQGALELVWRLFGGDPHRREHDEHVQKFRQRTYITSSEFGNGRSSLSNVENADDIEDAKEHETSVERRSS